MVIEAAQRLIAVSLGKIASSRHQRGGIRLHRSLLVAGVLMSARSATLSFHHHQTTSDRREDFDSTIEDEEEDFDEPVETAANDQPPLLFPDVLPTQVDERVRYVPGGPDQTVSSMPTSDLTHAELQPVLPDTTTTCLQSDLEYQTTLPTESTSPCFRPDIVSDSLVCRERKRRRDEVEESDESSEDVYCRKRTRYLSEIESTNPLEIAVADSSTDPEDDRMQTDSIQVTNLVQCFNSSFSGLLSNNVPSYMYVSSAAGASSDCGCGNVDSFLDNTDKCRASDSIISCSIHIREALETLSRPVLTMSV